MRRKFYVLRANLDEEDTTDFVVPLVVDSTHAADGQQQGLPALEGESAARVIMAARGASAPSGRALQQDFIDALRLGRLDGRSCDQLWAMLPGVGGVYSPPNAPFLRGLHDGDHMLGLSGFKEVLLELLEALEGVLHDKHIASIFRGSREQRRLLTQ